MFDNVEKPAETTVGNRNRTCYDSPSSTFFLWFLFKIWTNNNLPLITQGLLSVFVCCLVHHHESIYLYQQKGSRRDISNEPGGLAEHNLCFQCSPRRIFLVVSLQIRRNQDNTHLNHREFYFCLLTSSRENVAWGFIAILSWTEQEAKNEHPCAIEGEVVLVLPNLKINHQNRCLGNRRNTGSSAPLTLWVHCCLDPHLLTEIDGFVVMYKEEKNK